MFDTVLASLRNLIDELAPSAETLAQRERGALQRAVCSLLLEVARMDERQRERKHRILKHAMRALFDIDEVMLSAMIAAEARRENRLTSYFRPVSAINRQFPPERKVQLIEFLWRVAVADGKIDMYEDQLVRKLADLLYVPHTDFILAKHRAQEGASPE